MRNRQPQAPAVDVLVDGGDRACGELLLVLAGRARQLDPGTVVALIATDPAAALDLPAWCHLTGHQFLAAGRTKDDRPSYRVRLVERPRRTHIDHPWRLEPPASSERPPPADVSSTTNRREHP